MTLQVLPLQSAAELLDPFANAGAAFVSKYWWALTIIGLMFFLFNYYKARLQSASNPGSDGVVLTLRHAFRSLTMSGKVLAIIGLAVWYYVLYALRIFPDIFAYISAFDPFVLGALTSAIAPIWAAVGQELTLFGFVTGDSATIGLIATGVVFGMVFTAVTAADFIYYVWAPSSEAADLDGDVSLVQGAIYGAGALVVGLAGYQQLFGLGVDPVSFAESLFLPVTAVVVFGAVAWGIRALSDRGGVQGDD